MSFEIASCSLSVLRLTPQFAPNSLPHPESLVVFVFEIAPRRFIDRHDEIGVELHRAFHASRARCDSYFLDSFVEWLQNLPLLALVEPRPDGCLVVVGHARGNHGGGRKATDRRLTEVYHG